MFFLSFSLCLSLNHSLTHSLIPLALPLIPHILSLPHSLPVQRNGPEYLQWHEQVCVPRVHHYAAYYAVKHADRYDG